MKPQFHSSAVRYCVEFLPNMIIILLFYVKASCKIQTVGFETLCIHLTSDYELKTQI